MLGTDFPRLQKSSGSDIAVTDLDTLVDRRESPIATYALRRRPDVNQEIQTLFFLATDSYRPGQSGDRG